MNWDSLIFGKYGRGDIVQAVDNDEWQEFRASLRGEPLCHKYGALLDYLKRHHSSRKAEIRVTNYVNALKRGGMIK